MRARKRVERMTRARGVAVALLLASGIGAGSVALSGADSMGELDALAQKVDRVESLREIKDLDRNHWIKTHSRLIKQHDRGPSYQGPGYLKSPLHAA